MKAVKYIIILAVAAIGIYNLRVPDTEYSE